MRSKLSQAVVVYVSLVLSVSSLKAQDTLFVRGDVNQNGIEEVGDAISILLYLFRPQFDLPCEKAADVNDSGAIDISDAIYSLGYLLKGETPPPPPAQFCGADPTPDDLSCAESACSDLGGSFIISEIMASNLESLADEDGDTSDWIEIEMRDGAPYPVMDLGGWHLTDDPELLALWPFPSGVTMARGDFLIVFASGKDRAVAGSELHTNFRLDAGGDYLALVAPDGVTVVDEFATAFPRQLPDVSYGSVRRTTTLVQAGDQALYHVPTAADSNLGDSWADPGYTPSGWETGVTGIGFSGVETAGFEVTTIKANVEIDHLSVAEDVLNDPSKQEWTVTESTTVIDYFNEGESGNYSNDNPFPGIDLTDEDDFVVYVTGRVVIPVAASWSFGVNSDDGFSLELTGGGQTYIMEHPTPRGPADTIRSFSIAQAGPYEVTLLYYDRDGGAELELFAAQGFHWVFNPNTFRLVGDTGGGGLGFQGFQEDIETDLSDEMQDVNASLWVRTDFDVDDATRFAKLVLRMKYEDGFVAYLNGREVARQNAPRPLAWNSSARRDRPTNRVVIAEEIDLTNDLEHLTNGTNVLAIHGLNDSASNDGFLVCPELIATDRAAVMHYMPTPTPGAVNEPGAIGVVETPEFSAERGFYDTPFSLVFMTPTSEAVIRYTLDGSTPTSTTGILYSAPLTINGTSVVRAAAFKPYYLDSQVTTKTYVFVSDVIRQSPNGQAPGPGWPTGRVNNQVFDYGMDPDIVDSPPWAGQIEDALLALPSISLVTDLANLFSPSTGIYVNAGNDGRAWERRTSVELIHPDGTEGFGLDAGLRIRGAVSRSGNNPKHAFRLIFRREYGAGKLEYPLFGGEGVDEFDKIDLRTSQNYSWAFEGSDKNTFLRDVFSRDVQRDMRQPYTRSRYYHLYLNGQYWGLFQTQERADADFAASYLGGEDDDYDVVKNDSSGSRALHATNGTMDAYRQLYDDAVAGFQTDEAYLSVLGLLPDGTPDPGGGALVDPANLMDYMICTYYTGDPDAPVSCWAHFSNNVFAIYNRVAPAGFSWYRHDAEHSLGANGGLQEGRLLTDFRDRSIGQEWRHFNPAWLHLRLTAHPEYLLQFADRVNSYYFHGGILSSGPSIERWMTRAARIELAVIAASARWGDSKRFQPRTKDDWQSESNWIMNTFFPQRTQIVLNQMRSVNMFPDLGLVSFNQHGGEVAPGFQVHLTQGNGNAGTIYYTLDGSDPREWGGAIRPNAEAYVDGGSAIILNETTTVKARLHGAGDWGALTEARFTVGLEGLVINELMASNSTTLEDPEEPGEFPDWIELYNGTGETIALGGLYLTDDLLDLTHWQFAPGVSIGSGEYLVVYVDDDGTQGPLHTDFQLSRNGETIALVDSDGKTIIDSIVFDVQTVDVSYGRFPDGGGAWGFHQSPTPGKANQPHAP